MIYKLNTIVMIVLAIALILVDIYFTNDLIQLQLLLHTSCTLPENLCPARHLPTASMVVFVIAGIMIALGIYNIFYERRSKKTKVKEEKDVEKIIQTLSSEEKSVYNAIKESDGASFQSDIVEKSGLDKVKVTRILDKLEGRGLVERKRRGMSNVVVLKH